MRVIITEIKSSSAKYKQGEHLAILNVKTSNHLMFYGQKTATL